MQGADDNVGEGACIGSRGGDAVIQGADGCVITTVAFMVLALSNSLSNFI